MAGLDKAAFGVGGVVAAAAAILVFCALSATAQQMPRGPSAPVDYIQLPQRAVIAPVTDCAGLSTKSFTRTPEGPASVRSASVEAAKGDRAEFCLVKGYVAPNIQFELRLPTKSYTGRYLQGGCGGNCGMIVGAMMPSCDGVQAFGGAFAVGFEDSGHQGMDGAWALGGEQVRIDFAYRAAHAFSQAAKAIIAAYYGRAPDYSYFQGCSDGGREAMSLTQRYPKDFNGVIAGSPAFTITEAQEKFIWAAKWGLDEKGAAIFDTAAAKALHEAVIGACDKLDGLKDGQIDDPRVCTFNPKTIVCAKAGAQNCLTAAQADTAMKFYQGPVDETKLPLFTAGEPYGAELSWAGGGTARSGASMLHDFTGMMAFNNELPADTTVQNWKFDRATFNELTKRGAIYDAKDADIRPFRDAGGKLIVWYGAADSAAGSYGVLDYYQALRDVVGGMSEAKKFARVFIPPGVYHCFGGYVPYEQNFLGAMVNWVEKGQAPDMLLSSAKLADGKIRRRPLFAYPVAAKYKGSGDINDEKNFVGVAPRKEPNDAYKWAGGYQKR